MSTDFAPDCGAVTPEEECGECRACHEATAAGIAGALDAGAMTEAEAYEADGEHGTYVVRVNPGGE